MSNSLWSLCRPTLVSSTALSGCGENLKRCSNVGLLKLLVLSTQMKTFESLCCSSLLKSQTKQFRGLLEQTAIILIHIWRLTIKFKQ